MRFMDTPEGERLNESMKHGRPIRIDTYWIVPQYKLAEQRRTYPIDLQFWYYVDLKSFSRVVSGTLSIEREHTFRWHVELDLDELTAAEPFNVRYLNHLFALLMDQAYEAGFRDFAQDLCSAVTTNQPSV